MWKSLLYDFPGVDHEGRQTCRLTLTISEYGWPTQLFIIIFIYRYQFINVQLVPVQ